MNCRTLPPRNVKLFSEAFARK